MMTPSDSRFDFDTDSELTEDLPIPLSDRGRYVALFDAAHQVVCSLTLWEHDNPGAVAAFLAWASTRSLQVTVRDRQGKEPCTAYEVEIPPPGRHWITVYARKV